MKYLIIISYDGSKFYGFQRLKNQNTIQKEIEEALSKINKNKVIIKGAGRTDRNVHANYQAASFNLDIDIPPKGLKKALNSFLEPYIYIKDVYLVPENFHARFSVLSKKYEYKIYYGPYNPRYTDYYYQIDYKLDINKMKKASKELIGIHDFHNFVSGERKNSKCILYNIDFKEVDNYLQILFHGKSFYRYMVRNLVGALLDIGKGKRTIEELQKAINSQEKIQFSTAPACGLYLENIEYDNKLLKKE